jgi:ribosome-binding protein aMBF1 (putative translation factor)
MEHQDWTPVVVKNNKARAAARAAAAAARPAITHAAAVARRLEDDDLPKVTKSLSDESRQAMIRMRCDKKLNQTQLNTALAFPLHTVRDIEAGKLCPTPAQLNNLSRYLGVQLKFAS